MPVFDAKNLDADPDADTLLAEILHGSAQGRSRARKRGSERLQGSTSVAEALASGPRIERGKRGIAAREPVR